MTDEVFDRVEHPTVQTAESLHRESLRVATFKLRRGKRHLMCGRQDDMRPLCRIRLAPVILPACRLLCPTEITCTNCRSLADRLAVSAAKKEHIDLRDEGAFQIFSDMLLERATPKSLFIRRLVLVSEVFEFERLKAQRLFERRRAAGLIGDGSSES